MTQHSKLAHLQVLEAQSIHILREIAAEFRRPAILYSVGKDSSVVLRLAQKAFSPEKIPFTFLHIDTGFKFAEMIEFRDRICRELGLRLIVRTNQEAVKTGVNPFAVGTSRCCSLLKTKALLDALAENQIDAAIGGARRDEEKSRAKERVFSLRDADGRWNPRNQRPELWNLYNTRIGYQETMRVFPLSDWTELDVWQYIAQESIPVVPLYFARSRKVVIRKDLLLLLEPPIKLQPLDDCQWVLCRMRSLGCTYCTGAIRSTADTVDKIIDELKGCRRSERENRAIDHDQEASMEAKKVDGYF
jgi:sulfate adenylyltransferase subunit 2